MTEHTAELGSVSNPTGIAKHVTIPGVLLIFGASGVGTYVGFRIGGEVGAAVGALVGAFVGTLAAGYIKEFEVILHASGRIEVRYSTRF